MNIYLYKCGLRKIFCRPPPSVESWLRPCDQYDKKIIATMKPDSVIHSMIIHSYKEYMGTINIRAHIVFSITSLEQTLFTVSGKQLRLYLF